MCRSLPPTIRFSVSPLEKSPIHFGRNAKNSDLAASTSSNFSKADAQDLIASDREVPPGVIQEKWGTVVQPNYLLAQFREHWRCLQRKEASMPRTVALKEGAPPRPLHERHRPEQIQRIPV